MLLREKNKLKVLFILTFITTSLTATIYLIQTFLHFKSQGAYYPIKSMLISVFGSYYIFLLFVPCVYLLKRRFDIIKNWQNVFVHVAFAILMASIHIVLASVFNHLYLANKLPLFDRINYGFQNDFLLILIGYCGLLVAAYFVDYYSKFKTKESELMALKVSETERINHLLIKHNHKLFRVLLEDIKYVEAYDNYLKIHSTQKTYLIRKTLKSLNEELKDLGFIRTHRSIIVNKSFVENIEALKSGDAMVRLFTGEHLKLSRSYKANLQEMGKPL